jgi:acetolactate synthase I/III small subunit
MAFFASSGEGTKMLTTFAVYVDDAPGVLNRVASLFRRRAFNIVSLTVGHTEKEGVSRMTLVVDADIPAERITANLYKLIDVQRVEVLAPRTSVERDLAMIKVATSPVSRGEVMQLVQVFRARVVDVAPDSLIVEITGGEDKVDGLVEVLRPFGILEMVRTGRVAMARGASASSRPETADTGDSASPVPEDVAYSV